MLLRLENFDFALRRPTMMTTSLHLVTPALQSAIETKTRRIMFTSLSLTPMILLLLMKPEREGGENRKQVSIEEEATNPIRFACLKFNI